METLFNIGNGGVLFGWAALVLLPFWRGSQVIAAFLIPALLSIAYITLIASSFFGPAAGSDVDFTTIDGVRAIFASDEGVVIGWFHYLAFDLFVGAWEARDAKARGIPHLYLVPCLALTFMFGPVGLLLYFVVRTIRLRTVMIEG